MNLTIQKSSVVRNVAARTALQSSAIELRSATKRFGEKTVLHALDLAVQPGEFLAIVGRSGCGKSTLLRLLAGLDDATAGEVTIDNGQVRGVSQGTRIMFQEHRLLPWRTLLQNVGLGMHGEWQPIARKALEQVGLGERGDDWPSMLSGGQRQRVALARALVHDPRLLLLDEPLGALDALTRIEMQNLIEGLWQKKGFTVVLITHDVDEAIALADRVVLLEGGRVGMDIRVNMSRPRHRSSTTFGELTEQVLNRVLQRTEEPSRSMRNGVISLK